jgi:hypothetical protein
MAAIYGGAPVTLSGVVTKFDWANPHVWVFADSYEFEFPSRIELARAGWTADSIHVGDAITVEAIPTRTPGNRFRGLAATIAGRRLSAEPSAPPIPARTSLPTPRWPNGTPRLGPEPGHSGYWVATAPSGLYDTSAGAIAMNEEGLLANIADAPRVAPFLPWARGLYVYRQQNLLEDDPMAACLPPGGPRQLQAPLGVRILEEPARRRLFMMSQGANRNWRLIPLDGRAVPDPAEVTGSYFGYSSGRWEGDTLVIDAAGYAERFWFAAGGLPHTESLRLTERISRPDFYTLKYEVTVDDPGAYTRPWSGGWTLTWIEGDEDDEYFCDDYNRELEHVN